MDTNLTIEESFDSLYKNEIVKSKQSPLVGTLLIVVGLILVLVSVSIKSLEGTSMLYLLIMIGSIFAIVGIFVLLFRKTYYISVQTRKKLKPYEIYFDPKERDKLVRIMQNKNLNELKSLKLAIQDGLKLRVFTTPDGEACFSQVVTFIPYEYVNVTPVMKHTPEEAKILIETFKLK